MTTFAVIRFADDQYSTIGELQGPRCYVLERQATGDHPRIPDGTYELRLRSIGESHLDPVAEQIMGPGGHHGMIEVCDVPGRTDILIHWANQASEILGCLATGTSYTHNHAGTHGYWINESRNAYKRIYPVIAAAIMAGPTTITITSHFPEEPVIA